MAQKSASNSKPPKPKISLGKTIFAIIFVIILLVAVFGWFLPHLIDYNQVIEAIKSLTTEQVAILVVLGYVRMIIEGWAYVPTLKGLRVWQGFLAYTTSTAWANVIPVPLDMPIRWRMYFTWGFKTPKILLSFPLSGVFTLFVKIGMPVIALVILILMGETEAAVIWGAVIGIIALSALIFVTVKVVKSQTFTVALAKWAQSIAQWGARKIGKKLDYDFRKQAIELRTTAIDVLGHRWFEELSATVIAQLMQALILFVSLVFVGIPTDVLSFIQVLMVYSVAQLVLIIPITPGGMGVAEAAYISMLTLVAGNEWANAIGAGVFIFRIITWLLVVPSGFITWGAWRWTLKMPRFKKLAINS